MVYPHELLGMSSLHLGGTVLLDIDLLVDKPGFLKFCLFASFNTVNSNWFPLTPKVLM